jgi:hypothetical protein
MKQNKTRTRCKLHNEKREKEAGQGFLHVFSKKNRERMLVLRIVLTRPSFSFSDCICLLLCLYREFNVFISKIKDCQ